MRGLWLGVVIGLLGVAGVILLNVFRLVAVEVWRDRSPKRPKPEPPRRIPTSQEIVIENLRRQYFEGKIESDEFEARLWRAMTGADTPERIAEAEGIAAAQPERDEVFRLMREARDKELTQLHDQQQRASISSAGEIAEVWKSWIIRDNYVKSADGFGSRGDK